MKSLTQIIIRPKDDKKYANTQRLGNVDFVISSCEDDVRSANREAVVEALPHRYKGNLSIGDILIVHHNTFRHHYNMQGILQHSSHHFKEGTFAIHLDEYYLSKTPNGDWQANDRFCFVRPIKLRDSIIKKLGEEEPLFGEMAYPNDYLKSVGVDKGDTVIFAPDSEYMFRIDGEKMYRVYDHQITIKL